MRLMNLVLVIPLAVLAACATKEPKVVPASAPATATATPAPAGAPSAAAPAKPAEAKAAATGDWQCAKGTDSRLIKIEKREPNGCRLMYPTADKEIASSVSGDAHCIQVRSKVRENLEKSGFKCSN
jgi:hypothetical protein